MRWRMAATCLTAAIALGGAAGSSTAIAAKAPLWLVEFPNTTLRVPAGTALEVETEIESCVTYQRGTLAANGKSRDEVGGIESPYRTEGCVPSLKVAGAISSLAMTPAGSGAMTISAKDALHVLVEPWCVYTLPKTITFAGMSASGGRGSLSAALDKAASFGTCPAKRSIEVGVRVLDTQINEVMWAETT